MKLTVITQSMLTGDILLDGHEFVACFFDSATVRYAGTKPFIIGEGTSFSNTCELVLEGKALRIAAHIMPLIKIDGIGRSANLLLRDLSDARKRLD